MGHYQALRRGIVPVLNLVNLLLSDVDLKDLRVIAVEHVLQRSFNGEDESSCVLIKLDVRRSHDLDVLLHVFYCHDSGSIETDLRRKHHTSDFDSSIF